MAILLPLLATSSASPDWGIYTPFLQLGAAGLIIALILTGRLHTDREFQQMKQDRDDARAETAKVRQFTDERIAPALIRILDALAELEHPVPRRRAQ
jgi:hypothetical protein